MLQIYGGVHSYSSLRLGGIKSFLFYLFLSSNCLFSAFVIATMLDLLLSFTITSLLSVLLILLIVCLPSSHGLIAQDSSFPHLYFLNLSNASLPVFTDIYPFWVNYGTPCMPQYLNSFKREWF